MQHQITLVVDRSTEAASVEEFARVRIDTLQASLQGIEILKQEPLVLSNGADAYECVYKWLPVNGAVLLMRTIYVLNDGHGFTFAGNFSKKTIHTIGRDMDEIVRSYVTRTE